MNSNMRNTLADINNIEKVTHHRVYSTQLSSNKSDVKSNLLQTTSSLDHYLSNGTSFLRG